MVLRHRTHKKDMSMDKNKINPLFLMQEDIDPQNFSINEEVDESTGKKTLFIQGPMIVAEAKNKNGRVYPASIIEREVKKFEKIIEAGRAGGELNHPQSPEINPKEISHYITELKRDGNVWIGKAKVASTPNGQILRNLIEDGFKMGMSTRGLGTVGGNGDVNEDYRMLTIDAVGDPSGPDCFVEGILESKQFIIEDGGKIIEVAFDKLEKDIEKLPIKQELKEEQLFGAISDFMKSLKG